MVSHRTSASFVASCYAFLAATCMLFGLLFQFLLISQNLTSQEFHIASKRNMLRHGLCATKNVYNQGIIHNWFNFWLTGRMDTRTSVISLWCTSLAAFYLLDFISLFWYLFIIVSLINLQIVSMQVIFHLYTECNSMCLGVS